MKNIIATLFMFLSFTTVAFANWSVDEYWDINNSPRLKFTCDRYDTLCTNLCEFSTSCDVKELVCRDCIGTSILMTNIFEGMGTQYRSTGETVRVYEFVDFILQGMYVTFSSKSIYNQTDSYNSDFLKNKFLSLCPANTKNAMAFFSLRNGTNILEDSKFVICDSQIYRMTNKPNINVEDKYFLRMDYERKLW